MAKNAAVQPINLPTPSEIAQFSPPALLLQDAIRANAGIEVLERLMALQERWDANQALKAFNNAMADARIELPSIIKTRVVDYPSAQGGGRVNYRYEDLSSITEALSPILAKCGLSFRWRTTTDKPDVVTVTCIVSHRDGHSEETTLTAANDHSGKKNDIQSLGSAVTYLQRYTLKAAFGVAAAHDDDGHGSGEHRDDKQQPKNMADLPGYDNAMKQDMKAHEANGQAKPLQERNKAHSHLEEVMANWCTARNKTADEAIAFLKLASCYERQDKSVRPGVTNVLELTEKEAIIVRRAFETSIEDGDTNWRMEFSNRVANYMVANPKADKGKILKDLTGESDWKQVSQEMAKKGVKEFDKKLAEKGKK